jgi:hypothetical protein
MTPPPELQIPTLNSKIRKINYINDNGEPVEIPLPDGDDLDLKDYLQNYLKTQKE